MRASFSRRIRYATADGGKVPPPLDLIQIDHEITLYEMSFR